MKRLPINAEEFLTKLKIKGIHDGGEEISFCCPFHSDSTPSARMNKKKLVFFCHGCKKSGNIVQFLAEIENVSPSQAFFWLRRNEITSYKEPETTLLQEVTELMLDNSDEATSEEFVMMTARSWRKRYIPQPWIDLPEKNPFRAYMKKRGFNSSVLDDYRIGYDNALNRIVIPMTNEKGEIVGIKGRAIDEATNPRYFIYAPCYSPAQHIFLYHLVPPNSSGLIVCEGELNALMLRQMGWVSSVAIGGSHLSVTQAQYIRDKGLPVVLYFDPDDAGEIGAIQAAEMLDPYLSVRIIVGHSNDACSSTREQVYKMNTSTLLEKNLQAIGIHFKSTKLTNTTNGSAERN